MTRLIQNVNTINWVAVVFSAIAITFLLVMKIHVNDRFKKQLRNIPIPIELIVVFILSLQLALSFRFVYLIHLNKKIIIGTCVTYFAKLEEKFDLQVIEKIPNG